MSRQSTLQQWQHAGECYQLLHATMFGAGVTVAAAQSLKAGGLHPQQSLLLVVWK